MSTQTSITEGEVAEILRGYVAEMSRHFSGYSVVTVTASKYTGQDRAEISFCITSGQMSQAHSGPTFAAALREAIAKEGTAAKIARKKSEAAKLAEEVAELEAKAAKEATT